MKNSDPTALLLNDSQIKTSNYTPGSYWSRIEVNLSNNTKYYWKVIPIDDNSVKGECTSGIWWFTVNIDAISNNPFAKIATDKTHVQIGETIIFDGSDSFDPDGVIKSYFWNFDDGNDRPGLSVTNHSYKKSGKYNVKLIVTDDRGNSNEATVKITVNQSNDQLSLWNILVIISVLITIGGALFTFIKIIITKRKKKDDKEPNPIPNTSIDDYWEQYEKAFSDDIKKI